MASYNKFNQFVQDMARGVHKFNTDTLKVALTNIAPDATKKVLADITEISAANGYTAGGTACGVTEAITGAVEKVTANGNVVFTASGGTMGPLRYAVLYNSSETGNPLIAWWDYGSSVTLQDTETLTIVFDGTNGIFQIS